MTTGTAHTTAHTTGTKENPYDIFIIGGGVNGCGIARDAAGRNLKVGLAEMGDLAQATSSSSSKMFHGGLRYLEFGEIGLVRKALGEREVLLKAMPHIAQPCRFILPLSPDMRFDKSTPASRLLGLFMPWLKGRRPDWMIRMGLWLYDNLGKREILPGTSSLSLKNTVEGAALKDTFVKAFEYSDVCVDDARLVVLNAKDAAAKGADIMVQAKVSRAQRNDDIWAIDVDGHGRFYSKILINAGGPWVADIIKDVAHVEARESVRLVRGSHIITKKLFKHDKAYFLQGEDGRIIFMIPYEDDFTMIGTTEAAQINDPLKAQASSEERAYLIDFANTYLKDPIEERDIVHAFAGVRPLYEDGASSATAATREYVLSLNEDGAPLLNVFGGKITTYRKLAIAVLQKLENHIDLGEEWTDTAALPGGFTYGREQVQITALTDEFPFINTKNARRLVRLYGRDASDIFVDVIGASDMGQDFGHGFTEAELRYLVREEFARNIDDVIWRRTKLGLRMSTTEIAAVETWLKDNRDAVFADK